MKSDSKYRIKEIALDAIEHSPRFVSSLNENNEDDNIKNNFRKNLLENKQNSKYKFHLEHFLVVLIFLSVVLVIIETIKDFNQFSYTFFVIDGVLSFIFACEYIVRVWTADIVLDYNPDGKSGSIKPRLKYIFSFIGLIDLISFLPFLFVIAHFYFIPLELSTLRIIRLFRLFRIFGLSHYNKSLKKIIKVFKLKRNDLLLTVFTIFMLMTISATIMYAIENAVQPEKFSSIPTSMWWALATITTIGYGDIYPVTSGGQIITGIISMLGLLLIAVPTGIMSSGFSEVDNIDENKELLKEIKSAHNDLKSDIIELKELINQQKSKQI